MTPDYCGILGRVITKRAAAATVVLGYETAALASAGRLPTLTDLSRRHRWLAVAVVGLLIVHMRRPQVIVVIAPPRS